MSFIQCHVFVICKTCMNQATVGPAAQGFKLSLGKSVADVGLRSEYLWLHSH